ncbi:hypothetical protein SBADM41S_08924 [Streptomyces badius]
MNAKPVAVKPATTMPSTTPLNSRLRNRKISSTATAFALSSTTGAITVAPRVSALAGSAVAVAIQRVAKELAMIATSAAAHAPQAKEKLRFRQGPGSTRSSQRNAAISSGTGSTARPRPTRNPSGPVCSRTRARISSPHSRSATITAPARNTLLRHTMPTRRGR